VRNAAQRCGAISGRYRKGCSSFGHSHYFARSARLRHIRLLRP
jgi:hypothetical protein